MNQKATNCPEGCTESSLCPLNEVKAGSAVRIKQLSAGPDITNRLREMGFCEEAEIKVLSRSCSLICQVCNARLGISEDLGERILVEPVVRAPQLA